MKNSMLMIFLIIVLIGTGVFVFINQPMFGKAFKGERLGKVKNSPNYKNGQFQNLSITPVFAEGRVNFFKILSQFIFNKNRTPVGIIPSLKTDLLNLRPDEDILVWFGHSSYFIQTDGRKILVDPVFSGHASPFPFSIKAFNGSDIYGAGDIPQIDYLFITHDHWDHLDYETLIKLKPRIKKVICGLGTGGYLEYWGYDKNIITEMDWSEKTIPDSGFEVYSVPARHFSGRLFKRNQSLWTSFVLKSPTRQIFLGCDGGYDNHFAVIGKRFGKFDLAVLENGQYNQSWRYIHTLPDEVLKAGQDLHAKRIFPVHSCKFALANHSWDEPLRKLTELNTKLKIPLTTPIIGEKVNLKDSTQIFPKWWENVK
jgi:L-ascorbate metabolism protein UlaG (beta-lactamase superfamily)